MQRRKLSRAFKLEAVGLVRERGVAFAAVARDLDVHEHVLRRWVRDFAADPAQTFSGNGQMRPEQLEIERLRREVAKLKAERDIQKCHRLLCEGFDMKSAFCREAPRDLAVGMDMRGARCFAKRLSCLADTRPVAAVVR